MIPSARDGNLRRRFLPSLLRADQEDGSIGLMPKRPGEGVRAREAVYQNRRDGRQPSTDIRYAVDAQYCGASARDLQHRAQRIAYGRGPDRHQYGN